MSKRNVVWLAIIVVVGVAVAATAGVWRGLLAAVVVLVVSEFVERILRQRRRRARTGS